MRRERIKKSRCRRLESSPHLSTGGRTPVRGGRGDARRTWQCPSRSQRHPWRPAPRAAGPPTWAGGTPAPAPAAGCRRSRPWTRAPGPGRGTRQRHGSSLPEADVDPIRTRAAFRAKTGPGRGETTVQKCTHPQFKFTKLQQTSTNIHQKFIKIRYF